MNAARTDSGRILLVVTGGISAYKACDVVRELRHAGLEVQVILTKEAGAFVTATTFEALSGRRVHSELLPGVTDGEIDHIRLGRAADVVGVVPATANFLAKLHAGLCDDLASATLLALPKQVPILVAPAMNVEMWTHPVTQRNLRELKEAMAGRLSLLEPVAKELACGEVGPGGLPEPAAIATALRALLPKRKGTTPA
ncbi:MAG TPA: flavoprotein [Planctomycetota bacterium]|jgi:phosphopantothenoylcysteine decarboxylase/phosphopantothenate--cysteine ligase|nr:flavoprotein [Planctomycetota bacterium]